MAKTIKDIDYLVVSARIRAMESQLLTAARIDQILEARSRDEVTKVLQDCGYPDLDATHPEEMDAALSEARRSMLEDLTDSAPDPRYTDIFKLKYDYHNVKAILKAQAMNVSPDRMLMDMGRVSAKELQEAVETGNMAFLSSMLGDAITEAKEVLNTTRDPQLSDILLDRWYYREMSQIAEETGSAFLQGYVKIQIDAANLRTLVRTIRMGKSGEFLRGVLFEGGEIAPEALEKVGSSGGAGLVELYVPTRLAAAADEGAEALKGGVLTTFEKRCDDAVSEYLTGAGLVPFGEAPLVSFLAAKETEYTNLRIMLMGRAAGLDAEVIRSRLRDVQM